MTRWILMIALMLWAAPGWAATYYVATTGSDANSCATSQTIGTPKLTFASSVPCLSPGDTLYIRSGIYTERINLKSPGTSGTAGNIITIAGYPGESVTLRHTDIDGNDNEGPIFMQGARSYLTFRNLILDGVNQTFRTAWQLKGNNSGDGLQHHITLDGVEIKNFEAISLLIDANDITVTNSHIHNSTIDNSGLYQHYCIYIHNGTNVSINNSELNSCAGMGIHAYPGPHVNLVIDHNYIHDNQQDTSPITQYGGILIYGGSANATVYNNLIINNGSGNSAANAAGLSIGGGSDNNLIYNNTIYGNHIINGNSVSPGIGVESSSSSGNVIRNNIVYGNTGGTAIVDNGTGTTLSNNLTSNPNFVNASIIPYDFHVNTGSPAIGTGYDLTGIVTTDYYSTLRSAPYDIGAVKYTSTGGGGGGGTNNFTQVATDTFNRTAESPVNASNWVRNSAVGHHFIVPSANPTVAQPETFSSGDAAATWVGAGTFTNDQYCQVVLGPVATTGGDNTIGYGCSVRGSTSAGTKTEYALVASHSGWELRRDVAGTYLSLAKSTTTTFNQGDSMTLWVYGTSPPTFGMQKGTTDIDLTSATRCGSCGASGPITDGNASAITTGAPGIFYSSTESGGTDHGIDTWFGGNYLNGADVTAPSVPTGLTVTANLPNQLLVSWTASTDNVAVTSYTLQACTLHSCTNFATISTPSGVSYTYTGLANNTVYAIQVRANDAAGNSSAYATPVEATTLPSTQVPVISNPIPAGTAVVDASPITISVNTDIPADCKANLRTEGTAAYAALLHPMTANALVNSLSITPDQHVSNGGVNHIFIACDNHASPGHPSATTDMTFTMIAPGDATKPSTILDLTSTALDAVRMQLSWTAATDNTAVTGYNIYCSTGIGTPVVTFNTNPTTATPILVAGAVDTSAVLALTLGTVYNCVADAFDAAGNIALDSNVAVSQTFSALSAPTNVHLVGAPSNNIIELVWDPSTDVSAVGYHIYQSTVSGSLGSLVGTNTQATSAATHSSITTFRTVIGAAGTYYYTIKAINGVGQEGAASAQLAVVRTGPVARTLRTP